jgi:hypothetical protein
VQDKIEGHGSGSGPLDRQRSGSDDLTNQLQVHIEEEETEHDEETETEEIAGEEEPEKVVIDPGSLIPLEAFLQSLWFGHITAYPIRNQSFLSTGFEKMKVRVKFSVVPKLLFSSFIILTSFMKYKNSSTHSLRNCRSPSTRKII